MRKSTTMLACLIVIVVILCFPGADEANAQAGPTLFSPSNNATDLAQPISFNWSSITYGTINNLVIADNPSFSSPIYNLNLGASIGTSLSGFQKGVRYYWHVRVYVQNPITYEEYWTGWSLTRTFTTECPDPPTLTSPTSGSYVTQPVQLEWSAAEDAQEYLVHVDDDPGFGSLAYGGLTTLTHEEIDGLENDIQYYWRVQSRTDNCYSGDWSATWNFTTECPVPAVVVQNLPTDGSTADFGSYVHFEWTTGPDALTYNLQVDDNSDFGSLMYDEHTSDIYYNLPGFSKGVTYYWRIRGFNVCGYGDWSPTWSVIISCPLAGSPELTGPADGAVDLSLPIDFYWDPVTGATDYHFQLDDEPGIPAPEIDGTTGGATTVNIPLYLGYGTTYYWRVQAENDCGWGAWSEIRSFTMECPSPVVPTLTSPADAAVDVLSPALLEWAVVSGASSYQIQIDDDPAFSNPNAYAEIIGTASTKFIAPSLSTAVTYYWKVRASNYCGWGDWSASRSFVSIDPVSRLCGDVNNDDLVNILDIVYTINFKYKEGPEPCNPPPPPSK